MALVPYFAPESSAITIPLATIANAFGGVKRGLNEAIRSARSRLKNSVATRLVQVDFAADRSYISSAGRLAQLARAHGSHP